MIIMQSLEFLQPPNLPQFTLTSGPEIRGRTTLQPTNKPLSGKKYYLATPPIASREVPCKAHLKISDNYYIMIYFGMLARESDPPSIMFLTSP